MLHKRVPAGLIGLALPLSGLMLPASAAAQPFNFLTIDAPCSACVGDIARSTSAQGINPAGDIVGIYTDAVGKQHGFLLRGGQFTTIDVPGSLAGAAGTLPTAARGISPSGDIVGNYTAPLSSAAPDSPDYCPAAGSAACIKGFLYSHGRFSTVLFPGHPGAILQRITPDGEIHACFHDFDLMASMTGFTRTRFGYVSLLAAGGELTDPTQAVPDSMNTGGTPDGHTTVGLWTDMMTGHGHGYIVQDGSFHSYDVPGSANTAIWDINPASAFVGGYRTSRNHGFLQLPDGSAPITIDPPGSVNASAVGINPSGMIVGQYVDGTGHTHGFLAIPQ